MTATTLARPAAVPAMTNQELGDLIGCTHSMASRVRYGKRLPGDEIMLRIHDVIGWDLIEQVQTKLRGAEAYGREFQVKLAAYQLRQVKQRKSA